jgi:class 3 adenylate cyclase
MDDVRAVMDTVGIERAAILAWSEGVPLALLFASTYPDRVTHLMPFDGAARWREAPGYPGDSDEAIEAWVADTKANWGTGEMARRAHPTVMADPEHIAIIAKGERMCLRPNEVEPALRWFLDIDVRDVLPSIRVPTLAMTRQGSWMSQRLQYLQAHIDGAELAAFDGTWHAPWGDGDEDLILERIERFLTGSVRGRQADRVLATVLFTDIVSSTAAARESGDRSWLEQLARHDEFSRRAVEAHRGVLVKTTGDGILATFDGPGRAVACARELRARLAEGGIQIRAGLHTGEIERREGDIGGLAVHLAKRVMDTAGSDEIWVTRTVTELVIGSELRFEPRGEHAFKGFDTRWELHALTS